MNYIQNKLDAFDDNKFFKILNIPIDKVYAEKDGLRFDLQEINIKEIIEQAITEAYNKGQTDYHNHIVEKVKNEPNPFMGENDKKDHHTGWEYAKKDILSLLQDTNPKE